MTRTVLVTGASGGLGSCISERLASRRHEVVIHFHRGEKAAHELASRIHAKGGAARLLQFDVVDRAGVAQALERDMAQHGPYYGVVCNAGIHRDKAFPAMTGAAWDAGIRPNPEPFDRKRVVEGHSV